MHTLYAFCMLYMKSKYVFNIIGISEKKVKGKLCPFKEIANLGKCIKFEMHRRVSHLRDKRVRGLFSSGNWNYHIQCSCAFCTHLFWMPGMYEHFILPFKLNRCHNFATTHRIKICLHPISCLFSEKLCDKFPFPF